MLDRDLWITVEQPALPIVLTRRGGALGLRGFVHGRAERLAGLRLELAQGDARIAADRLDLQTGLLGPLEAGARAGLADRLDGGFYVSATFPGRNPEAPGTALADGPAAVEAELLWAGGALTRLRLCSVDILRAEPLVDPLAGPSGAPAGPRVGIAMATYNPDPALFARQIASLRAQSHRDWICVISDDGSHAPRLAAIRAEIAGDPRFQLLPPGRRLGFYRNFERACASLPEGCALVALSDQDDAWRPDRIERQIAGIADLPFGCSYSDMEIVAADGTRLSETFWIHRKPRYGSLAGLLLANVVTGMTVLARRAVIEACLPFPATPGLTYHDHWIALVAARHGGLRYLDAPLVAYVQHGANHTGAARAPESARAVLAHALGRIARLARIGLPGQATGRALRDLDGLDLEPARLRILVDRLLAAGPPQPGDRALRRLVRGFGLMRLATCGADWGERYRRSRAIELGSAMVLKRLVLALARRGRLHPVTHAETADSARG